MSKQQIKIIQNFKNASKNRKNKKLFNNLMLNRLEL